jgi:hypothetical protein
LITQGRLAAAMAWVRVAHVWTSSLREPAPMGRRISSYRAVSGFARPAMPETDCAVDELVISLSTVNRHIANTYCKLGVDHRAEAVARLSS